MPRDCVRCGELFEPKNSVHKFCSDTCKGRWKYETGNVTTESQYEQISGNWSRYFSRLVQLWGRKNDGLTKEDLLELLEEQDGRCALTGVELTCKLEKGVNCRMNASIDRIVAGGPYIKENCRLVCKVTNMMRLDMEDKELIYWCKRIIEHVT